MFDYNIITKKSIVRQSIYKIVNNILSIVDKQLRCNYIYCIFKLFIRWHVKRLFALIVNNIYYNLLIHFSNISSISEYNIESKIYGR